MLSDKVSPHPNIKLIDFGLAHRFQQGEEYRSTSGTPQYIGEDEHFFIWHSVFLGSWSICEDFFYGILSNMH